MAKAFSKPAAPGAKKTSPLVWVGLAAVGIAAFVLTSPEDTPKSTVKPRAKKSATTTKADLFTPADYEAKRSDFTAPTGKMSNAFLPLVVKETTVARATVAPLAPNTFLADGEAWAYTGMVEVNGRPQALLENPKSGDSVFLSVGDQWKHNVVLSVTGTAVELRGPEGKVMRVAMGDSSTPTPRPGSVAPVGVQPPALRGTIGNLEVTPLPAVSPVTGTPAPTNQNNNPRSRGRRRRNRVDNGDQNAF